MDICNIVVPNVGNHLRVSWGGNNGIAIYNDAFSNETNTNFNEIVTCKWFNKMTVGCLRNLSLQSYHIFESIQDNKSNDIETYLLKSREYRAVLTECEDYLTSYISNLENPSTTDVSEEYVTATVNCNMIKDFQLLWHLVEILFMKPVGSSGYLILELQHWLNIQQPHVSEYFNNLVQIYNQSEGDQNIERNENYWPTIIGLGLQNRKQELWNLLGLHSCANGAAIRTVRNLIEDMPTVSIDSNFQDEKEFTLKWNMWKVGLKSKLITTNLLLPFPELRILIDIMLGDLNVYKNELVIKLLDYCWYYGLVSYLFYNKPMIGLKDLIREESKKIKEFKRFFEDTVEKETNHIDNAELLNEAIWSLLNLDLGEFIVIISRSSQDSWWFLAHLVDLLTRTNPELFTKPLPNSAADSRIFTQHFIDSEVSHIREYFITEHALQLANGPGMVLLALNYCVFCPLTGRSFIDQLIDKTYLPTDKLADQLYNWCESQKLNEISQSIARRKCVEHYKQNNYGNAIQWCRKLSLNNHHQTQQESVAYLNRIASNLLNYYLLEIDDCNLSQNDVEDLLDCLGYEDDLIGKKMVFIRQIFQIKSIIKDSLCQLDPNQSRSNDEIVEDDDESISHENQMSQLAGAIHTFGCLCSSKLVCNQIIANCIYKFICPLLQHQFNTDNDVSLKIFDSVTLHILLEAVYRSDKSQERDDCLKLLLRQLANASIKK